MGWNRRVVVETLEAKRKVKSEKYWQNKQKKITAKAKAL
jgi:hypothetical protein